MALTWEFFVAIGLLCVGFFVVAIFVYLLFWPQSDLFDKLRGMFMKKKNRGAVVKGQKGALGRGQNVPVGGMGGVKRGTVAPKKGMARILRR